MKVSDFLRVEALVNARDHLLGLRDEAGIHVIIGGHHQSRDFVEHVAQAIRIELRHRIQELERQLIALGVTIE